MAASPQELYRSIAQVLSGFAQQPSPSPDGGFNHGAKEPVLSLAGPDCEEKALMERELAALAARIQQLEAKARVVDTPTSPIPPGDPTASQFIVPTPPLVPASSASDAEPARLASREHWVSNWLAV